MKKNESLVEKRFVVVFGRAFVRLQNLCVVSGSTTLLKYTKKMTVKFFVIYCMTKLKLSRVRTDGRFILQSLIMRISTFYMGSMLFCSLVRFNFKSKISV